MNKVKSIFTKILVSSVIITLFSTSLLQTTASAATTVTVDPNLLGQYNQVEIITGYEENQVSSYGLPPRKPSKDPYWAWVSGIFAAFVGVQVAQTITQNAINNGIDYACNKWKSTPGVKQACKIIKN